MKIDIFTTEKKYDIIYADPPWSSDYHSGGLVHGRGLARQHYSVMSTIDIAHLPIQSISKDNSILFLWATYPCLSSALYVIKEWGFRYITAGFTWIKTNKKSGTFYFGMGNYTRANAEICLIGVSKRFKNKSQIKSRKVSSLIVSEKREHSRKPDEVRDKIIELLGEDVSRIELFARQEFPGWDCWGDEV